MKVPSLTTLTRHANALPRPLVRAVLGMRRELLRLADSIVPPQAALLDQLAGIGRTVALHVAAKHRFADRVAQRPKTKSELARETGLQPDLVERVMSALIAVGIFEIGDDGHYRNNRTSECLRDEADGSLRAMSEYFGHPLNTRAWANVPDALATGGPVFDTTYGCTVWERFAEHLDEGKLFAQAMSELTAIDAPAIAHGYDWSRFDTICDVAGGRGTLLAEILTRHAKPRAVLFDEAYVLDTAVPYLEMRGVATRVAREPGSFFERVPSGADAYVLKDILHDWDDERCVQILRNVRAAMKPSARVLLCELPIDHARPEYPAPISDLQMFVVTSGGRQRGAAQFAALLDQADLRLAQVHPLAVPMTIFEAATR